MALIPKKIFRSINMMGNRIFNVKVNTPTKDDEVANLKTVTDSTTYDTEKSTNYINSFKHTWVTALNGKSFKQIFDDLFFPRVLPEYINPVIETKCYISNMFPGIYDVDDIKSLIFKESDIIKGHVKFNLKLNDRTQINIPSIKITNPDTSTQTFNYIGDINDLEGQIDFDFVYRDGIKIEYVQQFNAAGIKQDSYGDDYITTEFENNQILSFDLTQQFIDKSIILDPVLISPIRTNEGIPTYLEADIIAEFDNTNKILIPQQSEGIFDILIPISIINRNPQKLATIQGTFYHQNISGVLSKFNNYDLEYEWLLHFTGDEELININGIDYQKFQFNFGYYEVDVVGFLHFNF